MVKRRTKISISKTLDNTSEISEISEISKGKHPKSGKRQGVKSTRKIVGSALKQQTGSGKLARKIISKEREINARRKRGKKK